VLEIQGLVKRYGKVTALSGLDLAVQPGEVYGFLGRNGAGKTTTIRILMGITRADAGTIRIFEESSRDLLKLRQKIGYVAQEQNFYGWMTPKVLGRFVRGFYPTWEDAEFARLLRTLDLPADRKARTFSGGMKAKLALALALAHRPELLVLDEPTAGLDPVARREFLEIIRDQAERTGRTTFFSSHILGEVERVADRVGIVDDGRMRYEGPLADLSRRARLLRHPPMAKVTVAADGSTRSVAGVADLPPRLFDGGIQLLQDRTRKGERQVVVFADAPERLDGLLPEGSPWVLETLALEDIFVEMVTKPAKDDA
jgi:ABC-2 type transport system ATP-binding protein